MNMILVVLPGLFKGHSTSYQITAPQLIVDNINLLKGLAMEQFKTVIWVLFLLFSGLSTSMFIIAIDPNNKEFFIIFEQFIIVLLDQWFFFI